MAVESLTKRMWLSLYKNLMSEAKQFTNYNLREYAKRRIRDHFRSNRKITDEIQLRNLYVKGVTSLESLKRQVAVNKIYAGPKLVIENPRFKIPE